jgi:hypothetical protein
MLLLNDIIVNAAALFAMALFLTALRLDKIAFGAWMDKLQMSLFLVLFMLQEYKILADQHQQQPPEISNANGWAMLLIKGPLI